MRFLGKKIPCHLEPLNKPHTTYHLYIKQIISILWLTKKFTVCSTILIPQSRRVIQLNWTFYWYIIEHTALFIKLRLIIIIPWINFKRNYQPQLALYCNLSVFVYINQKICAAIWDNKPSIEYPRVYTYDMKAWMKRLFFR